MISTTPLSAQTFFWEDRSNGQVLFDCNGPDPDGEFIAPDNDNWSEVKAVNPNPCSDDPAIPRTVRPGNWTLDGLPSSSLPNSPTVDVVLSGGGFNTNLNLDVSLSTLTVAETNQLTINGFRTLKVHGGQIVNDGIIRLFDNTFDIAILQIAADTALTGNGVVQFATNDDNWITSVDPAHTLTVGPDQQLLALPAASAGDSGSRISAALINNGRITADGGGLQLDTHPKSNRSVIEAINGGGIQLKNVALDNAGANVQADAASKFELISSSITGGSLIGPGQFNVTRNSTVRLDGPLTIAENATIFVDGSDVLELTGIIENNGTLQIFDNGAAFADLRINGDVTLTGTGRILMDSNDDSRVISAAPGDVLTIAAEQEIVTNDAPDFAKGQLSAAILNQGTISADGGDLQLDTNDKTNAGVIRAINGGNLLILGGFAGINIDNTGGRLTADPGSVIELNDASINGGALDGGGRFVVTNARDANLNGPITIGSGTSVAVDTSQVLSISGNVTNDGVLEINDSASGIAIMQIVGNVTLGGSGQVIFNGSDDNQVKSDFPSSVLTVGPNQDLTTSAVSQAGEGASELSATTVNNGTISARIGGLQLDVNPKTNNGTFLASAGGTLEVRGADNILTNYDALSGTLTGGSYEARGSGSTINLDNAAVTTLSAGTSVVLEGSGSSIPALGSLSMIAGTLTLENGASLSLSQNVAINGAFEVGLPDGAGVGFANTALSIEGDLDLTGAFIDVTDFGVTDGRYTIASATGVITGTPQLRNVASTIGAALSIDGNSLVLDIVTAPEIIGISYESESNQITITYRSVSGEVLGVRGSDDLEGFSDILPDTVMGTGGILEYRHTPPPGVRYFYRFIRSMP